MKRFLLAGLSFLLMLSACASAPPSSGRFNARDVEAAFESLYNDCVEDPGVSRFISDYKRTHKGALPTIILGRFKNETSEHINTSILARKMEVAISRSGMMEFVAGGDTRDELRAERADQNRGNASESTAAAMGNETGAVLMLTGSLTSMMERYGKTTERSYYVGAELSNIETNKRIWMADKDITHKTKQPGARL